MTYAKQMRVVENKEKLQWSVYLGVCGMPGTRCAPRPLALADMPTRNQAKPHITHGESSHMLNRFVLIRFSSS